MTDPNRSQQNLNEMDQSAEQRSGEQSQTAATIVDFIKSGLLYVLPHHAISRIVLKLTRLTWQKNAVIRWFIKKFDVDMSDAVESEPDAYKHFNAFFTRALKPAARPICDGLSSVACPADGCVSALGPIADNRLFQAKGHDYTLAQLLGNQDVEIERYRHGSFITIYLSPKDYHRLHMPLAGQLQSQTYVPGRLFSVAPHTVKTVNGIFARNERVIAQFDTNAGAMALVLVGAINVAAIETVWSGLVTPPRHSGVKHEPYPVDTLSLDKGQEMGRFNMGSTIIAIFEQNLDWHSSLRTGTDVRMGQAIAELTQQSEN